MATDTAPPGALRYVAAEDLDLLLSLGHRRSFSAGETIYARGERVEEAVLVEVGEVEVVTGEGDRLTLGAGDVFGAGALAGGATADVSLRAASDVVAVVAGPRALESLVREYPGTAARLCLGLAVQLARTVAQLGSDGLAGPPRAGAPTSETSPAVPRVRDWRLEEVSSVTRSAVRVLASLPAPAPGGDAAWIAAHLPAIAPALDRVSEVVERIASLDQSEVARAAQAVALARGELRPALDRSHLGELMLARAPEEPARYRSLEHIFRGQPDGSGPAGLLLDAYLLARPFAEALRERRREVTQRLNQEVRRRARPGSPVRILSLGCGPARTLADLLEQPGIGEVVSLTCVDDDQEAIVHANNLLKSRAPRAEISFHHQPPAEMAQGNGGYQGVDIVASLYVADYLPTSGLVNTLVGARRWLNPDGLVLLAAFGDDPDRWVTDIFLDWRPVRHNQGELFTALERVALGGLVAVQVSDSGRSLFLTAPGPVEHRS